MVGCRCSVAPGGVYVADKLHALRVVYADYISLHILLVIVVVPHILGVARCPVAEAYRSVSLYLVYHTRKNIARGKEKAFIIDELRQRYSLKDLLKLAGLARSTFYYYIKIGRAHV